MEEYFNKFDKLIKLKNLALIHLNDSDREFDSKIDRHAYIGKGFIYSDSGINALAFIINFASKNKIPMVLETGNIDFAGEIDDIKQLVLKKNSKPLILKKDIKKVEAMWQQY